MLVLVAATLEVLNVARASGRSLSPVDGNMLLTKCHAAQRMEEVTPKLSGEEGRQGSIALDLSRGLWTLKVSGRLRKPWPEV